MSKLLSDEGLRKEIANILLLDRQAMEPYVSVVDDLINLINTQKRLYAEMVIGEDLSLAEYRPNLIPAPDVETAIQIEGKNRHNELLKEQRARIK